MNDVTDQPSRTKNKNRAANRVALQQLMEAYPQVFDRKHMRPLKIGIQEDLIADGKLSKTKIKRGLASYVHAQSYYRALREGANRIDIQGQSAGVVSKDESEYARTKLKEINKARRAKQNNEKREDRLKHKLEMLVKKK